MCKAIVIVNDTGSAKRLLGNRLASEGIKVVNWVPYCKLHQAVPGDAEVAILNLPGINGNEHTVAATVSRWPTPTGDGMQLLKVSVTRKGASDISSVHRWMGARSERRTVKPKPVVEVAPSSAPKGPPCVVCGRPVTSRVKKSPKWRKTCSPECAKERQRQHGRKMANQFNKRAEPAELVDVEVSEVNHRAPTDALALVVLDGDTEPRALDTDIAERAGMAQPRDVRRVIKNNFDELSTHGPVHVRALQTRTSMPRGGERIDDVEAFYLTEDQALNLLALLRTEMARQFRPMLIKLFSAYRKGQLRPNPTPIPEDDSLVHILAAATDEKIKKLRESQQAHDRALEELKKRQDELEARPPVIVDKRPMAHKYADPGPALPIREYGLEPTIRNSGVIRKTLQRSAAKVLARAGVDASDRRVREYAHARVNTRGRAAAGLRLRRALTASFLALPAYAETPLCEAFESDAVIADATTDLEEWLTR